MKYFFILLITGIGGLLVTGNLIIGNDIITSIIYYVFWIGELCMAYFIMWIIALMTFGEVNGGYDMKAFLLLVVFSGLLYWQSDIVGEYNRNLANSISKQISFKEADSGMIIRIPGNSSTGSISNNQK